MPHVALDLLILPEHMRSLSNFDWVRVAKSFFVSCVSCTCFSIDLVSSHDVVVFFQPSSLNVSRVSFDSPFLTFKAIFYSNRFICACKSTYLYKKKDVVGLPVRQPSTSTFYRTSDADRIKQNASKEDKN